MAAALAIEATRVVTLPRFWAEDSLVWFLQIENKFLIPCVSTQAQRLELLLGVAQQGAILEVQYILMRPCSTTPYDDIKDALLKHLVKSEGSRIQRLLNLEELGDYRPT